MKQFSIAFLVFISLFYAQCKSVNTTSSEKFTYLALGDSYTIGQSVAENERWPNQLVDSLNVKGFNVKKPTIIAKTGWRTDDLLNAMSQRLKEEDTYDIVSVLIGVNNQYQKKSILEYEKDLKKVFTEAIKHSKNGKRGVFALNIPDYGLSPMFAFKESTISAEIEAFNVTFKKVASSFQIPVYDINSISKAVKNQPELFAGDGLHPSGKEYTLWVREVLPYVTPLLK